MPVKLHSAKDSPSRVVLDIMFAPILMNAATGSRPPKGKERLAIVFVGNHDRVDVRIVFEAQQVSSAVQLKTLSTWLDQAAQEGRAAVALGAEDVGHLHGGPSHFVFCGDRDDGVFRGVWDRAAHRDLYHLCLCECG
jgi:hypothetical protein